MRASAAAARRRRPLCERMVDTRGDNRNTDDAVKVLVECRADDDVGVLIDFFADARGRLVDLIEREIAAAGDGDEKASRALHRGVVDQRIGDRRFGGRQRPLFAFGLAGPHHRLAHFAHDGAHVGKVEVDQAFLDHQIGDAGDAGIQHLVRHGEGIGESRLLVRHAEQILVRE